MCCRSKLCRLSTSKLYLRCSISNCFLSNNPRHNIYKSFKLYADNIVHKGYCSIQSLTRMCRLGFSYRQLLLAYTTYIRPILEYCFPIWGPQTQNTAYISTEQEYVQKRATIILLGHCLSNHESALELSNLPASFA